MPEAKPNAAASKRRGSGTAGSRPAPSGAGRSRSRGTRSGTTTASSRRQLADPYDTTGPKAVLGVAWAGILVVALLLGAGAIIIVMSASAAMAAWQLAHIHRRLGADPPLAALVAALLPVAALESTAWAGICLIVGAAASLGLGFVRSRSPMVAVGAGGATVGAWLVPGLSLAGVGFTWRVEPGAVVMLVALVLVYDAGAYLVGADSSSFWAGPVAGIAAVGLAAFSGAVIGVPPFDLGAAVAFGALAAAALILGPVAASLLMVTGRERAPFVRRVDSFFVVGLIWPLAVGLYVAGQDLTVL